MWVYFPDYMACGISVTMAGGRRMQYKDDGWVDFCIVGLCLWDLSSALAFACQIQNKDPLDRDKHRYFYALTVFIPSHCVFSCDMRLPGHYVSSGADCLSINRQRRAACGATQLDCLVL